MSSSPFLGRGQEERGNSTLYPRSDGIEATWSFVNPILNAWKNDSRIKLYDYPFGSWGPKEANALFDNPEVEWRFPCKNFDDSAFCEL